MDQGKHWLNRERLSAYPRIVLALCIAVTLTWLLLAKGMVDLKGKPLGYDFITYWAASSLGLGPHPEHAYQLPLLFQAEQAAVPGLQLPFAWYYPPTFYLVVLPLSLLPYPGAYLAFVLTTLAAFVAVFRRVVTGREAMWLLAAFSGIWLNFFHGQNAFLTAALAAGALLCLERRPVLAGVCIGLLAMKPHLALLFPLALIAAGAWRTLLVATLTAAIFTVLSTLLLGQATLAAFVTSLPFIRMILEEGILPWVKMPTTFALARLLGAPLALAYVAHVLVALGATAAVWRVWRQTSDLGLRGAALMTATFLVSPYCFDYDLAWLAFPIAWLALAGLESGWRPGEREVLLAAWVLPMFMAPVALLLSFQIAPLVLLALLWMVLGRTGSTGLKV